MTLRSRPRPLRRLVIRADADAEAAVAEAELGTADALGNDEDMVAKVKARVLAKVAAKKAAKKKKLKEAGLLDEDEDEEGDEFAPVAAVPGQAKPKAKAKAKKKKRKYIKPDGTEVELEEDDDEDDEEEPYVAPPPPPVAPNKCTFHIEVETNFGDHLCLTGGHALLGDWSTVNGIPMDWVEGNKWSVTVNLPAHQLIQVSLFFISVRAIGLTTRVFCLFTVQVRGAIRLGARRRHQVAGRTRRHHLHRPGTLHRGDPG